MEYIVKIEIPVQTGINTFYKFDNQESAMIFANTVLLSTEDPDIRVSIIIRKKGGLIYVSIK